MKYDMLLKELYSLFTW